MERESPAAHWFFELAGFLFGKCYERLTTLNWPGNSGCATLKTDKRRGFYALNYRQITRRFLFDFAPEMGQSSGLEIGHVLL